MSDVGSAAVQETERYVAGVPCWVDTHQPDPHAAAEFYGGLFGWTFEDVMPPGGPTYLMARLDGKLVGAVGGPGPELTDPPSWATFILVDDADAAAARIEQAGGSTRIAPVDAGPAGRTGIHRDPGGAEFSTWQPGRTRGVEVCNAPGSWNFSGVHTADLGQTARFYAAVFGWEPSAFDDEGGYWRRPGYGDLLEQLNPGTRERNAAMGAPDRFEDAVATYSVLGDGGTPGWDVTFAVADCDATVARAVELGATVVVPAESADWVRAAVLADPQGAQFVASQFTPPA